jgi:hypothetical protein
MAPNITRTETDKVGRNYPPSPFRLFEDFFNDWAVRSMENRRSEGWIPAVDVLEREGNLILMVSLPGINEKDIAYHKGRKEIARIGRILLSPGRKPFWSILPLVHTAGNNRFG